MSKKILVAYASVSGSTREVAEAIGEVIRAEEVSVDVLPAKEVVDISGYSAVALGSSIRVGKWLPGAVQFLDQHGEALSQMPVAYFTTCLTMVEDTEDSRRTVLAYLEPVLQKNPNIRPVGLGLFAGSLDPDRLSLPMVRPDLLPQGDYRNWEAIRAWAREIRPGLLAGKSVPDKTIILRDAVLSYTDMSGTNLSEADLRGSDLQGAKLRKANLHRAKLNESELIKADLSKANLREARLNWAELNRANLKGADLNRANLIGADLNHANLERANLSWAILNGANLSQANLKGANLSHTDLNWADLRDADLRGASLTEVNLGWANLSGANLSEANLQGARYNNQTEWPEGFSAQAHGGVLVGGELY